MTPKLTGGRDAAVLVAPLLLVLYGVLRLVDGLDGKHGPGLAWNVGHTLFFVGFLLFGVVTFRLRRIARATTGYGRHAADAATAVSLFGIACFLRVILGDLFAALDDAAPLPEPLQLAGPLAFQLGWLVLLIMPVTATPRALPVWSPLLVLAGFLLFSVDLDLLPVGGLLLTAGLLPVARIAVTGRRPGSPPGVRQSLR
ncbi:hypothetical protein OG599_21970 [Streptomyces sp. NBC_01335]|uniref:hypothetical protein n=1 Tax=Streptomyces sp. NBC_01335 TaxID=2903828 RepID=UPI002E0E4481|nr:hypothetical protein OG599_21970 [Streptomyces sp. NBC_01335]